MTSSMRFSLLGPVRAQCADREIDLGPMRERTMLSVLLCRLGEVMSGEALLDAVWDTAPPSSGTKVIPTYIYRLRRTVAAAGESVTISSARDGYVLHADPDALDITAFSRAATLAREPHAAGTADTVRGALTDALTLWRGVPFTGLTGPLLAAERRRLEEQRLNLLETRFDLELRHGRNAAAIDELPALCATHPWRERFAVLLMTALYRGGRQADALHVYHTTRRTLRDSLGVDPGAELVSTHEAVLRCDERLAAAVTVGGRTPPRRDLPAAPRCLVGRHAELARLTEPDGGSGVPRVLTVDGMAGVGKTALALRVAHTLAPGHPDGQLYLDLQGYSATRSELDPAEALRRLLGAVGVTEVPGPLAERAALWRSHLAGRRMLLMLDNVSHGAQVAPLLPGTEGATTVVVSRRRLYGLPATAAVSLSPLPGECARGLLGRLAGEQSLAHRPAAVATVLATCDGLPVAICRAAEALRGRGQGWLDGFAERLCADPLRALRAEGDSLAEVFAPCAAACSTSARRILTALTDSPVRPVELEDTLCMCHTEIDEAMQELEDAALAVRDPAGFRTHPLLVAYAATLTEQPDPTPPTVIRTGSSRHTKAQAG